MICIYFCCFFVPERTFVEAERARERGIMVFVVAVGEVYIEEAYQIANDPNSDYVVQIKTQADIEQGVDELLIKLCNAGKLGNEEETSTDV